MQTDENKKKYNLFLFGEPEQSEMIRKILESCPLEISKRYYHIGKKKISRKGNGLIFHYRSPWNPDCSVVVQCGISWGKHSTPNHMYDSIPGFIVYSDEPDPNDPEGANKPLCAGFFDNTGEISGKYLYVSKK